MLISQGSAAETKPIDDRDVDKLLTGAIDLHCHSSPASTPRILDHHEAFEDAAAAGFRAIVYKDHNYLGVAHAAMLEKVVPHPGTSLFSGLALNNASGGINPYAVAHAAQMGAKIIWMPTMEAANHYNVHGPRKIGSLTLPGLSSLDISGKVSDSAKSVLDLIAESEMVLAGGHLHVSELYLLFEEAKSRGVTKLLINHPSYLIGVTESDMRDLAAMGVYMEHAIALFLPGPHQKHSVEDLVRFMNAAGVGQTVLASDMGVPGTDRPVEGFRSIVRILLESQVSSMSIRAMISRNPATLLGIEVPE